MVWWTQCQRCFWNVSFVSSFLFVGTHFQIFVCKFVIHLHTVYAPPQKRCPPTKPALYLKIVYTFLSQAWDKGGKSLIWNCVVRAGWQSSLPQLSWVSTIPPPLMPLSPPPSSPPTHPFLGTVCSDSPLCHLLYLTFRDCLTYFRLIIRFTAQFGNFH